MADVVESVRDPSARNQGEEPKEPAAKDAFAPAMCFTPDGWQAKREPETDLAFREAVTGFMRI